MEDRQLICELCDWFGLDNLYPYTDNEKILNEFKKVLEHKEDIHLALLTTSKQLKKQDKILEILKKTLNNSFLCLIKNKEEQEKVKEWLDERES